MSQSFQLDPREILGVDQDASLQVIHESYRSKVKRYHPDHGGEEWAFRVLNQAFEILSRKRIAARVSEEMHPRSAPATENPFRPVRPRNGSTEGGSSRRGIFDRQVPPERLVLVEMLILRYDLADPMLLFREAAQDRNLSCTVHVVWPPPSLERGGVERPGDGKILSALDEMIPQIAAETAPLASSSRSEQGRFSGWLSYPSATRAGEGFRRLHAALGRHGLGVEQWVHEVSISKE